MPLQLSKYEQQSIDSKLQMAAYGSAQQLQTIWAQGLTLRVVLHGLEAGQGHEGRGQKLPPAGMQLLHPAQKNTA